MGWKLSRAKRLVALVAVAGAAVAVWGGMQVFASSNGAPASTVANPSFKAPDTPLIPGGSGTLLRTYLNTGISYAPLVAGFGPYIDGLTTINCAPPPGALHPSCVLVADENVQLCFSDAAGNRVALLPAVDGTWFSNGPFLGLTNGSAYCQAFSWQDSTIVGHGLHTVQTEVYTQFAGGEVAYYSIQYKLYNNHA